MIIDRLTGWDERQLRASKLLSGLLGCAARGAASLHNERGHVCRTIWMAELVAHHVSTTPAASSVGAQQRGRQRWQRGLAARTGSERIGSEEQQRKEQQRVTAPRAEEILRESGHECEGAERASCNCARPFSHAWQKSQVGAELQRARQRAKARRMSGQDLSRAGWPQWWTRVPVVQA